MGTFHPAFYKSAARGTILSTPRLLSGFFLVFHFCFSSAKSCVKMIIGTEPSLRHSFLVISEDERCWKKKSARGTEHVQCDWSDLSFDPPWAVNQLQLHASDDTPRGTSTCVFLWTASAEMLIRGYRPHLGFGWRQRRLIAGIYIHPGMFTNNTAVDLHINVAVFASAGTRWRMSREINILQPSAISKPLPSSDDCMAINMCPEISPLTWFPCWGLHTCLWLTSEGSEANIKKRRKTVFSSPNYILCSQYWGLIIRRMYRVNRFMSLLVYHCTMCCHHAVTLAVPSERPGMLMSSQRHCGGSNPVMCLWSVQRSGPVPETRSPAVTLLCPRCPMLLHKQTHKQCAHNYRHGAQANPHLILNQKHSSRGSQSGGARHPGDWGTGEGVTGRLKK